MKCPVCKIELSDDAIVCSNCKFDDLHKTFLNVEDAVDWMDNVVIPYRKLCDYNDVDALFDKLITVRLDGFSSSKCRLFDYVPYEGGIEITGYNGFDSNIVIPNSIDGFRVYKLGDGLFQGQENIDTIALPESLKYIGSSAFRYCSISNIEIPDGCEYIGDYAFYSSHVTSVSIPGSCKHIGESAFAWNHHLKSIILNEGIEEIGDFALACTEITKLIVPHSVIEIPMCFCSGCDALDTVIILGASIIKEEAFDSSVKNFFLPETLKHIDPGALGKEACGQKLVLPMSMEFLNMENLPRGNEFTTGRRCVHLAIPNDKIELVGGFRRSAICFYCNPGSNAYKYARQHGICVFPLSEFPKD